MKRKEKYYLCEEIDDERYHSINFLISEMKDLELSEVTVMDGKRITGLGYFYCQKDGEICEKGQMTCGKGNCENYIPRNAISGCCKHWGYCYEPDKEYKLTVDGKIITIK